jgi:DNA (cytosine-5)-methyltransferase 1
LGAEVHWPTPRTKGMCGGSGAWQQLKEATTIEEARMMGAGNGGQLNPTWVEWLMGWPLEWTDLRPLATDKFRQWRHSHGAFLEANDAD